MALSVDSFGLLWKELSANYKVLFRLDIESWTVKDTLMVVGACYTTYKALSFASRLYKMMKQHAIPLLTSGNVDLPKRFGGSWAGKPHSDKFPPCP